MIKNLLESTLNLISPPVCGICNKLGTIYICKSCYKGLKIQEENKIDKYENKFFSEHFWIFKYKNKIREKIIDYKFNDKSYVYTTFVEIILMDEIAIQFVKKFDVIIPVPIHKKRYKQRGYNQSELIAKALAKHIKNIEYSGDILKKVKNIRAQSTLDKLERLTNISGAYEINYKKIKDVNDLKNKKILLFDDVYTTGSTVNECAKVLNEITNKEIGVFTIAKD